MGESEPGRGGLDGGAGGQAWWHGPGLQRVWLVRSPGLGGGRLAAWPGGHLVGGLDFVGIGVRFGERRGGVSEAQRVGGMMRVSGVWHCEGGFGAAGQDWARVGTRVGVVRCTCPGADSSRGPEGCEGSDTQEGPGPVRARAGVGACRRKGLPGHTAGRAQQGDQLHTGGRLSKGEGAGSAPGSERQVGWRALGAGRRRAQPWPSLRPQGPASGRRPGPHRARGRRRRRRAAVSQAWAAAAPPGLALRRERRQRGRQRRRPAPSPPAAPRTPRAAVGPPGRAAAGPTVTRGTAEGRAD